jgi:hypothetical protein
VDANATFEVRELLPGSYVLQAWRRGANGHRESEPAVVVEGLLVRAGETCRDPRIQGLHIESELLAVKIRVVDRASNPVANVAASIVGAGDVQPILSAADGICRVRAKQYPVDVDISAFGFLRRRLTRVDADCEVVLDEGYPIRLRASVASHGSKPRYLLHVTIYSVDDQGLLRSPVWGRECPPGQNKLDEHSELALRMPAAGVYECRISIVVLHDEGFASGGMVEFAPAPRITVLSSAEEQVFNLAIPQSAIDEAIERAHR